LLTRFQSLASPLVYAGTFRSAKTLTTRALYRAGLHGVSERIRLRRLKRLLQREDIGLIYSNTVVNGGILDFLSDLGCPVITHVHELEQYIRYQAGLPTFGKVRKHTHHYLAASKAVQANLTRNHGIPENQIDLVYEFIPIDPGLSSGLPEERRRIREKLRIPPDALVVCGSGTTDWRKGPDLFVQLSVLVRKRLREQPVYFLWVGGLSEDTTMAGIRYDMATSGVERWTRFLGHVSDPLSYYAACDVFALVSREDPYPLVMLEAASLGKPVVCFDGSGGAVEFVEKDCGRAVPYLDMEEMAAAVVSLLESDSLRRQMGQRAAEKVAGRHTVEKTAPKVLEIIRRFLVPEASPQGRGTVRHAVYNHKVRGAT
jgi:glycosyltransferase involved in cell wall biosynthesis